MLLWSFSCLVLHFLFILSRHSLPYHSLPTLYQGVHFSSLWYQLIVGTYINQYWVLIYSLSLFALTLLYYLQVVTCAPYWYANTLPTTVSQSFSAPIDVIICNVDAFQYTWVIAIFIQNECIQKSNPLLSTILSHLHTSTSHAINCTLHLTLPLHSSLHYTFYKSTALYSKCTV